MPQRITSTQLLACLVAIVLAQYLRPEQARAADQCILALDVTGSLADEEKTAYKSLYDGEVNTYLNSPAKGWQYVQFDFGCQIELYALRRYMTQDGKRTDGARTSQGEGILYSDDGVSWSQVTNDIGKGWESAKFVKSSDGPRALRQRQPDPSRAARSAALE